MDVGSKGHLNEPLLEELDTKEKESRKDKQKPQAYLARMFNELNKEEDNDKYETYEDKKKKDLYKKLTAGVQVDYPFPACRAWMRHLLLKKSDILFDLFCGITIGLMVVPESMAFAQIAGMPLKTGVFSILVPLLFYPIFGTCRHLSPGPVSVICLMVGEALIDIPAGDARVEIARTLCFVIGACLVLFGIFKFGFIENLLSRPMIHGFLSGLALYILCDQLYKIKGAAVSHSHDEKLHDKFFALFGHNELANKGQIAIAAVSLIFLYTAKYLRENCGYGKNFFFQVAPLWVLVGGLLVVQVFDMKEVKLMTEVPNEFPKPGLPDLDKEKVAKMLPLALIILISGYVETLALTKRIANQKKYVVDFNMEMIAHGICNVLSPCVGGTLPSFGAISRTIVTVMVGGRTNMNTIFVLMIVFSIILVFYPIIRLVPMASVNSIVFFTVSTIIDVSHTIHYARYHPFDCIQFCGAFFFCVYFNVDTGLVFCLLYAIFSIVRNSSFPSVSFHTIGQPSEQELKSTRRGDNFSIEKFVEQLKEAAEQEKKFRNQSFASEAFEQAPPKKPSKKEEDASPAKEDGSRKQSKEDDNKSSASKKSSVYSEEESEKGEEEHHSNPFILPVYRRPLTPKDICFCINTKCKKRFHILIISISKVFFFANAPGLKTMLDPIKMLMRKINKKEGIEKETEDAFLGLDEKSTQTLEGPQTRAIIFDCSKISYIDATALEILNEIIEDFKQTYILVKIADASPHKTLLFDVNHIDRQVVKDCDKDLTTVITSVLRSFFDPKVQEH